MVEYGEITALRRSARLIHNAGKSNFSFLTGMVFILLILLVVAAIGSIVG